MSRTARNNTNQERKVPASPPPPRDRSLTIPAVALACLVSACGPQGRASAPPLEKSAPAPAGAAAALTRAESAYADLRALRDRISVSSSAGLREAPDGIPLATLARRADSLRATLEPRLGAIDSVPLGSEDRRALAVMRRVLDSGLGPVSDSLSLLAADTTPPDCMYDPRVLAASGGAGALRARAYACYGWAGRRLRFEGRPLSRFTASQEQSPERRRKMFLALQPLWRSMDGAGGSGSPYRLLLGLEPRGREPPAAASARALGIEPDSLERWLVRILETWRASTPDRLIDPWDWEYVAGRANRVLGRRIPRERLDSLDEQVFRALGADPAGLGVHYDLAPRDGKTPVAFTDFGRRARRIGGAWAPAEPWVFATYETGDLTNLNELLHETGHAVHIAAIHTRPAFLDWPDSDPFSEALGDFVALDVYEPGWQYRWLGDSVPLADGLRARYAGIVMDVAWALFEARLLRDPALDPNQVWTAITRNYLRIRPHPELSWWAMRGQLVDSPGYMMNYAAGAIVSAAIRARTRELHGPFATGDSTWYGWVAPRLYRWGLERSSRQVITDFLGGPVTPAPILQDMRRMHR